MKKVAILLSGLPRQFISCYPHFQKQFLNRSEFTSHTFLHTWQRSGGNSDTSSFARYQDEGSISDYLNLYRPRASFVESLEDYDESFERILSSVGGEVRSDCYIKRYISMLYGIYKSFKLIKEPESYDLIIRTRADLFFKKSLDFPNNPVNMIDKYGSSRGPGDVFAAGTPEFIKHYSKLFDNIELGYQELGHINTETLLPWWLSKQKEEFSLIDLGIEVVRPEGVRF